MAFSLPGTLKLAQLKQLAFKCGLSTSGTKPLLTQRLLDEVSLHPPAKKNAKQPWTNTKEARTRILSIDMGIRNLAYCVLDVPTGAVKDPGSEKRRKDAALPCIHAWHRLAVSSAPTLKPADLNIEPVLPAQKEAFDPATLSAAAYTLLRHRLLTSDPTLVLIERQRFRSMGSKHILEWTIRVNMFESILYAVLCTLREEGVWKGEVRSIAPGKVGPFWIGEEEATSHPATVGGDGDVKAGSKRKARMSQSAKIKSKGLKMDLVRSWLESGNVVVLGNPEVEEMARAYREKWDRMPGRRKGSGGVVEEGEKMGKLDDLADCLLQGMAWVRWEENKRAMVKDGVEALLEI